MPDNSNKTHKTALSATLVSLTLLLRLVLGDKDDRLNTWSKEKTDYFLAIMENRKSDPCFLPNLFPVPK